MQFCARCANTRWVCEAHPDRPWGGSREACPCGAPGEPCPVCNRADAVPELPDGFVPEIEADDG